MPAPHSVITSTDDFLGAQFLVVRDFQLWFSERIQIAIHGKWWLRPLLWVFLFLHHLFKKSLQMVLSPTLLYVYGFRLVSANSLPNLQIFSPPRRPLPSRGCMLAGP